MSMRCFLIAVNLTINVLTVAVVQTVALTEADVLLTNRSTLFEALALQFKISRLNCECELNITYILLHLEKQSM